MNVFRPQCSSWSVLILYLTGLRLNQKDEMQARANQTLIIALWLRVVEFTRTVPLSDGKGTTIK